MKKILIVEDDKDLVEVMELNLIKYGFQTNHAYDGEEAIKKINEYQPDIIILDIMLPKINGELLAKNLNENTKTKNIPIIGISGKIGIKEMVLEKSGVKLSAFFYKPFLMSTLVEEIKKLLNEK